ncbi:uncharacterized protein LOC134276893 [Saccostrea cucullata]|uniref:uncharacterized protein LOC134276893 n=1 Tax=Saccostrea cuccullata TaxID=36930 RepID=UPI002ED2F2D5
MNWIGKIRTETIVTVVIFSVIDVFTIDGQEASFNWFEAQEICQGRGLTTETTGLSNKDSWTGRYIRLSQWIKIIGCYPDSNITNHYPRVVEIMERKSVGACQEICKNENSSTFAVKLNKCTCLKGLVNFDYMFEYSPSHCNYSCDSIDEIYSRECGGETAYNVYISDQDDSIMTNKSCMLLQCDHERRDPKFISSDCSHYYTKICLKQNSSNEQHIASNWSHSMERCKRSEPSSYMYGNLDLTNASGSCLSIPNGNSDVNWIGIARQSYAKIDQGWIIEDYEKAYFMLCQKCRAGKCTFSSCTDKINTKPFCSIKIQQIWIKILQRSYPHPSL